MLIAIPTEFEVDRVTSIPYDRVRFGYLHRSPVRYGSLRGVSYTAYRQTIATRTGTDGYMA